MSNDTNGVIGRCVGETSLVDVSFISKEMPKGWGICFTGI